MRNFVEFVLKFVYSIAYATSKPIRTPITAVVHSYHTTKQLSVCSCHNKTAYVYSYSPKIWLLRTPTKAQNRYCL